MRKNGKLSGRSRVPWRRYSSWSFCPCRQPKRRLFDQCWPGMPSLMGRADILCPRTIAPVITHHRGKESSCSMRDALCCGPMYSGLTSPANTRHHTYTTFHKDLPGCGENSFCSALADVGCNAWEAADPALGSLWYVVILVDQRGFGMSQEPDSEPGR